MTHAPFAKLSRPDRLASGQRRCSRAARRLGGAEGRFAPVKEQSLRVALARSLFTVSREIVTAPCRWRVRDWGTLSALTVATVAAFLEKWPLQSFIQRFDGRAARFLAVVADAGGSGLATVAYGVAAFIIGRSAKSRALVDVAIALGIGGAWCWALTKVGQIFLAECRPNEGGALHLMALDGHGVSGHASAVALLFWTVRGVLERNVRDPLRRLGEAGVLAWAILVCWSRVYLGLHFAWNVILGFAIGSFTGRRAWSALARADHYAHCLP